MLLVISPAKKMDCESNVIINKRTEPKYIADTEKLLKTMKEKSSADLMSMMSLSKALSDLNYKRYQEFENAPKKPALFAFKGDVYSNMAIDEYKEEDIDFSQKHLRILSGLYGILSPLDLIRAYRLEMSIKIETEYGDSLYSFWQDKITQELQSLMSKDDNILINLASIEYFSVINTFKLSGRVINIIFKNFNNGSYKTIGILAKKARGMMADFIIRNKISVLDDLKKFSSGGYKFQESESSENAFCFFAL